MVATTLTIQNTLPHGNKPSSNLDLDNIFPFILLSFLQLLGTISCNMTILIMIIFGVSALYLHLRPRQNNRSVFLFSWTISSIVNMFLIFQLRVITRLRMFRPENFVFLLLVACTLFFFYKMKSAADSELATRCSEEKEYSPVRTSGSKYCHFCHCQRKEGFLFYSVWWDCYVSWSNYFYFLIAYGFAIATLVVGVNWGLKILCTPYEMYGPFIMPHECDDVYFEFRYAIGFVACIYGGGYLLVAILVMVHQLLIVLFKCIRPEWQMLVSFAQDIRANGGHFQSTDIILY